MKGHHSSALHLVKQGARFFGRVAAITAGLVLMIVGLALGVTMIMLPVGLVVGLAGVLILLVGLFAHFEDCRGPRG